ncbi:energy-coupling factor ABC transporter permease [Calothrix sp. NIES-3974]|uniref:energy-coupling factor ABC transporter permease n=1 Tax=Calothrix sp. NIES-3974 TaxID=2005462 RepID=UPI000B60B0B3|nr:energy-coupling factor ABC transporter permease [Calothrix sp. NIES-3974]BAZ03978.1 cobalamin biosynthesis protein CbiM [Calothrix sp. NIES-3974]
MHVPDGFISFPVALGTGLVSTGAIAFSLKKSQVSFSQKTAPIFGLTTAFIFAAQMVNFPVTGGTSGHLLGGVLAAIILGSPWLATLSTALVLIIQAVFFADGGITALGVNILNISVIGVWVGWGLTQILRTQFGNSWNRLPLFAGIGAGISVVMAAIACSIELALSHTVPLGVVLPAMAGIHVLIGIGEGIITAVVVAGLVKFRPDLFVAIEQPLKGWLIPVIGIFVVAAILSLFASSWPDGLEAVAEEIGFAKLAENIPIAVPTPFADYSISGLNTLGTSISGIVGAIICFVTAFVVVKFTQSANSDRNIVNP